MIQAICWVLIHSLWQGLLFTVATGLVMLYTKRKPAAMRYGILSGLFFLFLAVCGGTFLWELHYMAGGGNAGWDGGIGRTGVPALLLFIYELGNYCSEHASVIVLGWSMVFLARCVRMTAGVVYTQRIRHYGTTEAPVRWKERVQSFCGHLQIGKTVLLLESRIVNMPMVIGHLKPVIFIPLGLLTSLPEAEIEAVLLHELAHIRRHDYFVNFLQHVAENIFFFNPGLLWISSLLREERENCCDDIAIAYTGNKTMFVRALVSFKEHTLNRKGLAMAFPSGKHQLLQRVTRITHNRNKGLNPGERLFFLGSCLVVAMLLAALPVPHQAFPAKKEQAESRTLQAKKDKLQAELNMAKAMREQEQAKRNQEQVRDREQAKRNREQVLREQEQALKDQVQVKEDREMANRDLVQAKKDFEQAETDRVQAIRDKEQMRKDR